MADKNNSKKNRESMGLLSVPVKNHVDKKKKPLFNMTHKLRAEDVIEWPEYRSINYLIENHPVELWNKIHKKEKGANKIRLIESAYKLLKSKVETINAKAIEELKTKKRNAKLKKDLKNEIKYGIIGTRHSRFKKLNSKKI